VSIQDPNDQATQGRPPKSPGSQPIVQNGLPSASSQEDPCPGSPDRTHGAGRSLQAWTFMPRLGAVCFRRRGARTGTSGGRPEGKRPGPRFGRHTQVRIAHIGARCRRRTALPSRTSANVSSRRPAPPRCSSPARPHRERVVGPAKLFRPHRGAAVARAGRATASFVTRPQPGRCAPSPVSSRRPARALRSFDRARNTFLSTHRTAARRSQTINQPGTMELLSAYRCGRRGPRGRGVGQSTRIVCLHRSAISLQQTRS